MHVGIGNLRWRGKRSRHSRRMRNPQFYVSGKRPIAHVHSRRKNYSSTVPTDAALTNSIVSMSVLKISMWYPPQNVLDSVQSSTVYNCVIDRLIWFANQFLLNTKYIRKSIQRSHTCICERCRPYIIQWYSNGMYHYFNASKHKVKSSINMK